MGKKDDGLSDGDVLQGDGDSGASYDWWADVSEAQLPMTGPDGGIRRPPRAAGARRVAHLTAVG